MNALIFLLTTLAVLIKNGACLNCYTCNEDTCASKDKWEIVYGCGLNIHEKNKTGVCLTEVYTEKNDASTEKWTARLCVTAFLKNGIADYKCNDDSRKIIECKICTSHDLCNDDSSDSVRLSYQFAMLILSMWLTYFLI